MSIQFRTSLLPLALCSAFLAAGCATAPAYYADLVKLDEREREIFGDFERQEFGKQLQVRLPAKLAVASLKSISR